MELNILNLLSKYGYAGMFFLIMIENVFPPIPSEAILPFGGFLTEHTDLQICGMILAATTGSLAGAMILYWIGRQLPINRLDCILKGRWIQKAGFKEDDLRKTLSWFDKHKKKTVLIGRCIPVVRSLISIPAGMDKMPVLQFLFYTAIGSGAWNSILLCFGKAAGNAWYKITRIFEQYTAAIITIIVAVTILTIAYKLSTIQGKD